MLHPAGTKRGVSFEEIVRNDTLLSLKRSVDETLRMLKQIGKLKGHKVKDMQSINDSRRAISALIKPLVELIVNLQNIIVDIEIEKKELENEH